MFETDLSFDAYTNRMKNKRDNKGHIYESNSDVTCGENSLNEKGRCWDGYEPVPGKKAYEEGSCKKI